MGYDRKYGKITTENGDIPKDEPVFLLRSQDVFSAFVVRMYAALRRSAGDPDVANEIENTARVMTAWPVKKKPD